MNIYTTDYISDKKIETISLVKGATVQKSHIGKDFLAGLKSFVGGELSQYTEMMQEAREKSVNRMIEEAKSLGADAIVGVRFTTSSIMDGASEIMAYGTAVRFV